MKRVLILSGGGVKGAIQLPILERIEEKYDAPISEVYDLIVASSVGAITGGIMATRQVTARRYTKYFMDGVAKIFSTSWYKRFWPPRYDRKNFFKFWDGIFEDKKDIRMYGCRTKMIITSVNMCDNRTHFFKSWEEKDSKDKLKDVISRSFAAPYFFGKLVDMIRKAVWLDGGVGSANCPVDEAVTETIMQGWLMNEPVEFTVIGCGYVKRGILYKIAKKLGTFKQLTKGYMNIGSGGLAREQSTHDKVRRLKAMADKEESVTLKYYNAQIPKKMNGLDKVKYAKAYYEIGLKILKEKGEL